MIDAHQHFWALATPGHEWPTEAEAAINRDFGPGDLMSEASGFGLEATILVQSQPGDQDTDWMLELAERTPLVAAVIGWVDLAAPDAVDRISAIAHAPKLRGFARCSSRLRTRTGCYGMRRRPRLPRCKIMA